MYSLIVILVGLSITLRPSIASDWNYGALGPDVWSDFYPSCSGRSQSPINIRTGCTIYRPFAPFRFSPAYRREEKFKIINNGHTIVGTYVGKGASPFTLTGGGLNGTYKLINFHLHWGENYKSGSEHLLNGAKSSGEIHFVHEDVATGKRAVLGIFIRRRNLKNAERDSSEKVPALRGWTKYLSLLNQVQHKDDSVFTDLNLSWLVNHNLAEFWRYNGSLTTPPCTEKVIWTLMKEPLLIPKDEFQILRRDILTKSFRSVQPLYDRIVFQSFPPEGEVSKLEYITCLLQD